MERHIYELMREVEDHHWWFTARRAIAEKLLGGLSLPDEASILDIGCGTGGNLELLSDFGSVNGIDCDAGAVSLAQARGVGRIMVGRMPGDPPFFQERFNLVTLFDVLEHIEDDAGTLKTVHAMLADQGYLLITVPAFHFLWSAHDVSHHHQRRYSRSELKRLLELSGFRIKYLSYYNFWLFPLVAVLRGIKKISGGQYDEEQMPPAWLNTVLKKIMASERHLMPEMRYPFGVSLIAVCQRK